MNRAMNQCAVAAVLFTINVEVLTQREWSYESTTVCDGYDPDGNVFQLFEPAGR